MKPRAKPKIICTLGTTTDDPDVLRQMIRYGMNCARLNTAYATIDDYKRRIEQVKSIADIPIMMDIKGPQVRVKSEYNMHVRKGDEIMLGFKRGVVYFNKDFIDDIHLNDTILFENGTIEAMVIAKDNDNKRITLRITNPGDGNFHKDMGANVPGRYLNVDRFSKKDIDVIDFTIKNNLDYIALSFTRNTEDVKSLYKIIKEKSNEFNNEKEKIKQNPGTTALPGIIAKIEDKYGIENLENIIRYTKKNKIKFGVMIARGDMYVELPYYKMPRYQKNIIRLCKKYDVPVITATGLLSSMTHRKKPTRAEISDVANAVLDGSDALMLSAETSNSRNPVLAVKTAYEIMNEYIR